MSGIPKTRVHVILSEMLFKKKVSARWVLHMLSDEQKARRLETCTQLLARYNREGNAFLSRIVAIDETWIRDFESELKSQSNVRKHTSSPRLLRGNDQGATISHYS